jgi:hypothetical protein
MFCCSPSLNPQASINELVVANNAYAAFLDQNKEETMAERKVLTLFHTAPEQLQVGTCTVGPQQMFAVVCQLHVWNREAGPAD